jgi:hypothetical protein
MPMTTTIKLPTGKVKAGTDKVLELTDGTIHKGHSYLLPSTYDKKTIGVVGRVTDIIMAWGGHDVIVFWVRLEDTTGQGWQFEFHEA